MPTEAGVLHALAAILGVDEKILFEKAGQDLPEHYETSPTVEQALASLRSDDDSDSSGAVDDADDVDPGESEESADDPEPERLFDPQESEDPNAGPEPEPRQVREPEPISVGMTTESRAGYLKPPEPYVLTPASPPYVEPSYMEDSSQRQLYRVRNLATLVVAVALVIALLWALSESLGALGSWWEDFFGSLRL